MRLEQETITNFFQLIFFSIRIRIRIRIPLWNSITKNRTKIFGEKISEKNFGKKILEKKFWKKNVENKILKKKFWKKMLRTKFWKKNFRKKFWQKNVGKINNRTKIFITKIYSKIDKCHIIFALLASFDKNRAKDRE